MNNKTEEMSELVETLRAAAEKAEPITTDLFGDRYFTGVWSTATLDKNQDDFIALASPANILKLLSSLPPSGAASEATVPVSFVLDLLREEIRPIDLLNFDYAVNGSNNMIERLKSEVVRYGAEALHED